MKKRRKKETIRCSEGRRETQNSVVPPRLVLKAVLWLVLLFLNLLSPNSKAGIVIDHESVKEIDRIPDYWLREVKKMLLNVPGESHSAAYRDGLILLKAVPGYERFEVVVSSVPEAPADAHLRITANYRNEPNTGWNDLAGEEDFWTSARAFNMMKQHLMYMRDNANPVHAFGFAWCYDMANGTPGGTEDPVYKVKWAGDTYDLDGINHGIWGLDDEDNALTGNELNMQDYLNVVDAYNANVPQTVTFFTTGPVDGWLKDENGYQAYLKHEFIRAYVRNSGNKVLFDYADILSYDDDGTQTKITWVDRWGDTHEYPFITPTNLGDGSIGHIGQAGAVRLAKALWVLMARIAGWDDCPAVKGDFTGDCLIDLADIAVFTDCWLTQVSGTCDETFDLAPAQGDGVIDFKDFTVLSEYWESQFCPVTYMSDFNGNCVVDRIDLEIIMDAWLSVPGQANWNGSCDLSPSGGDGVVDFRDFSVLAGEWLL